MNWYLTAKYGLYVTLAYEGPGTGANRNCGCYPDGSLPQSVDELADAFDVDAFVRDCVDMGVEYVTFTAYHAHLYVIYPSEVISRYLPGHASKRDLIRELIERLHAHDIKLQLYIHATIGDSMTEEERAALSWYDSTGGYLKYNNFVNEFFDELTKRYGEDIDSYYFDMIFDQPFLDMIDRPRLYKTLKENVPNTVITGNGDTNEAVDYGSREDAGIVQPDLFKRRAYPVQTVICHTRTWWATEPENGKNSANYSPQYLYKTLVLTAAANVLGGGLAIGASPYVTRGFEPSVKESLVELNRLIKPVAESILGTLPSSSYVTASGSRIRESYEGILATRSADGIFEYLHILIPPKGNTLKLSPPLDGAVFRDAVMLRDGRPAALVQDEDGVRISIPGEWDELDTVIRLTVKERTPIETKKTSTLPQQQITVTASQELADHPAGLVLDGRKDTFWCTGYGTLHGLDIDLGGEYKVTRLRALPRQDGTNSAQLTTHITAYGIYAGVDKEQLRPVATGEWKRTLEEKSADFPPMKARFLRLTAGPEWLPEEYCTAPVGSVSLAELNIDIVE